MQTAINGTAATLHRRKKLLRITEYGTVCQFLCMQDG
jgi:hypothetical protein